jgi:hypothetical protein
VAEAADKLERRAALTLVMRGLDPRIHLLQGMDCRVKPGNDEMK